MTPDPRPTVAGSALRALYEQAEAEVRAETGPESGAAAHPVRDTGFAVYRVGLATDHLVAIFVHAANALSWAEAAYPGCYRVEAVQWEAKVIP